MYTKTLRFLTATVLGFALAAPATALADASKDTKAQGGPMKGDQNRDGAITQNEVSPKRWERLKNADSNKDGKVTQAELAAFFKAHGENRFQHADKNGDGSITKDEVPAQRWEHMKNADANKDGKLTKDELAAFFKAHGERRFQRADKNGDGALTQAEVPAQRWEHMKNADANKDGKLTKDELRGFFQAKRAERSHAKPEEAPR